MSYLAKNNAYGLLSAWISSGASTLTLQAGQGDRFPVIIPPDFTFVTLENAAGLREIVKVTARAAASDVLTIVRAQEGTTARSWSAGDVVELRMVASLVETAMGHPAATSNAHAASAISAPATGALGAGTVASQLAALEAGKQPAFTALGIAKGGTGGTTRRSALAALGVEAGEFVVQTTDNATTDIGAAPSQNIILGVGAKAISGFATAPSGTTRRVRVAGAVTLINGVNFNLPGGADIVTAYGDHFETVTDGVSWFVRYYQRADGLSVIATKASVGLGAVDNTADAVKSVNYAASAGNADTLDGYHYNNLPYAGDNSNFDWELVRNATIASNATLNVLSNYGYGIYYYSTVGSMGVLIPCGNGVTFTMGETRGTVNVSDILSNFGTGGRTLYLYKLRKTA